MLKGRVRNMFPGGNTSVGFFSFYNYIINRESAKRVFILKGGPGVGKSTFMKKISETMQNLGYDAEHMHCSSDNNSLDGVVIPSIGVALIDGTSPHVCDPVFPGTVDEIIHLGDFWNEEGLKKGKENVIRISKEVGSLFSRAYGYLGAAARIRENTAAVYSASIDESKVNKTAKQYIDLLFEGVPVADRPGRARCLFASAITPSGLKNYIDELVATDNVYMLAGFPGAGTETVLERIKSAAQERGFSVEAYYCAFKPDKLEHLLIPGLKTAFTTAEKYHASDVCTIGKTDFRDFLDGRIADRNRAALEYNQSMVDNLLDKAVETIHEAKALHDEMETYYIPNMDFGAVQKCWEKTMQRIMIYADE